jgi:NEDD8-activating enzyme E1
MTAVETGDWQGRYYHVDQILDAPGPRTDPSFMAGDGVRAKVVPNRIFDG